jgi:hypothetical protein
MECISVFVCSLIEILNPMTSSRFCSHITLDCHGHKNQQTWQTGSLRRPGKCMPEQTLGAIFSRHIEQNPD